jgi:Xaa-Pro aminopeptidase
MDERFTSTFFTGNREKLRELFSGTAPIVLTAAGLLQRGGDSTFLFAQDASFWYLTGIDDPDIILVMDKGKEYLIVPGREASRQAFDGSIDDVELTRRSGITTIYDDKEGWRQLGSRLKRVKHVATLAALPGYVERYGFYANPARANLIDKMMAANSELELLDVGSHLARLRCIKQPVELEAIQEAIDITMATLQTVSKPAKLTKFGWEYEIEAAITQGFRSRGASGHGFEPIVASGGRACTLHNVANNGQLASDELVVMDVGAEVQHYSADITRTVALGAPSRRQQLIFDTVLAVQDYAKSLLKPGVFLREYEKAVELFMGEKLRELGLIQSIDHDEVRRFFPHATTHFLGLNVHDVGDYERPLEVDMVLTVEPGIYIAEEDIGIRIEDDVRITPDGIVCMSERLPRQLVSPTIK